MNCVVMVGRHRSLFKDRSITFTDGSINDAQRFKALIEELRWTKDYRCEGY